MIKIFSYKRIIAYLVAYVAIFIYSYVSEHGNINSIFFIRVLGATSAISLYWGLKLSSIRLREKDKLRSLIDKLHVPGREIIIHIFLVVVVIGITVPIDSSSVVEYKKIDKNVLSKIEETFCRTDIAQIIEIDDKYLITFSDNSKKLLQLDNK